MRIAWLGLPLALLGAATCGGEVNYSPPSSSSSSTGATITTSTSVASSTSDTGGTTGSTSNGVGATGRGAAGGSTSTGGGTSGCADDCKKSGFTCCGSICVNLGNDFNNCGGCGIVCNNNPPFCSGGTCAKPPCSGQTCSGTKLCCGPSCCDLNELCCEVQSSGPIGGAACHKPNELGT